MCECGEEGLCSHMASPLSCDTNAKGNLPPLKPLENLPSFLYKLPGFKPVSWHILGARNLLWESHSEQNIFRVLFLFPLWK